MAAHEYLNGQQFGKHRKPGEQWNVNNNGVENWDEATYQRTWGQNDMSQQPDIPKIKITGGVGNVKRWD